MQMAMCASGLMAKLHRPLSTLWLVVVAFFLTAAASTDGKPYLHIYLKRICSQRSLADRMAERTVCEMLGRCSRVYRSYLRPGRENFHCAENS